MFIFLPEASHRKGGLNGIYFYHRHPITESSIRMISTGSKFDGAGKQESHLGENV